jgi:stringent starvation protein B
VSNPLSPDSQGTSTRPYLVRALHDWCTDNGFTPYVAVYVDASVRVPQEYVKNNEIVLNIGFEATSGLKLGNEFIEFKARFGGAAREIVVPIDHVVAIYARENGQGMAFPVPSDTAVRAPVKPPALAGAPGPRAAEPGAGLRLAHSEDSAMHAVPAPAAAASSSPPEPPDHSPPPGGRPSLKRVK